MSTERAFATTPLDVRCQLNGEELTVALRGVLDLDSAPRLWGFLEPETRSGAETVVIDLGHLRMIDSSGVSLLLRVRQGLSARGARLVIRRPRGVVERVLDLSGFSETVTVERAVPRSDGRSARSA